MTNVYNVILAEELQIYYPYFNQSKVIIIRQKMKSNILKINMTPTSVNHFETILDSRSECKEWPVGEYYHCYNLRFQFIYALNAVIKVVVKLSYIQVSKCRS
jgi:hypothetical protein